MVATLWLLSLLTITLIRASECVYAAPPLVKYRRLDNTPFGFQDVYMPEKRTKTSLSIIAPLDVLRQRLLLEIARRQMRENSIQAQKNREILRNIGKRSSGNERPSELERFEPYQQHVDLSAIVNTIAAAAAQPNDRFYYFNMQAPDYPFDDTNEMNALQIEPSRFRHPFQRTSAIRLNDEGDNQAADPSTNSDDNEQAWHQMKQAGMHMKQQPFMNAHHSLFRQLNQQLEEKAANSIQHRREQQQQQEQSDQGQQQLQQQHQEKQQNQNQPLKSYDNGEFIQSLNLN